MKIRIENPTPGGARFTSSGRARLYVAQGCARLSADGKRLRFLEDHHRKQSAELSARETLDQEFRLSATGYDNRNDVLTLEEIKHLPALRPVVLATKPKRVRRQSTRSGKLKILVQDGIPMHGAPVVSIDAGRKSGKTRENVEMPKAA